MNLGMLTDAVSDYFFGTEIKELCEKQRRLYKQYHSTVLKGILSSSEIEEGINALETISRRIYFYRHS